MFGLKQSAKIVTLTKNKLPVPPTDTTGTGSGMLLSAFYDKFIIIMGKGIIIIL